MITHHPSEDLLLDYAAGTLSEPVALAVAGHLSFCGRCRKDVARLEAVGGELLDTVEPAPLADGALGAVMARLGDFEPVDAPAAAAVDAETAAVVPEPLLPYLGRGLAHLAWRKVGRMFEEARLPTTTEGLKATLMRLKPGAVMPSHTHRGNEYTLVLAGGYSDGGRYFGPGDFDARDPSHVHRPVVDDDEPCLCLVVLDAPLSLTGTLGRFVNPFLRV